ncbi:MAG: hypothetical protein O2820_02880 [Planctomycetota bacterium]|nr:hypothetical protein [Planctomycetota bacterium]MDA1248147.1 hypothetical protein [Planctomycetota bacterium]
MIIAAENNWLPSAIVGAVLVVFGLLWMWSHVRAWRVEQGDDSLGEFDRAHFANRFRRRMQTSGMVVLIGILIPAGDVFVWKWGPWTSTAYWLGILIMAMWVGVQALGDFTAVQSYSRAAMASVNSKRQQAEAELAEYRRRQAEEND